MTVEARNLTVMFTDIKGFTARTSAASREALVDLLTRHERLVVPAAKARGGTIIKSIGDAFLITFTNSTNALLAAIEIQQALRSFNFDAPAEDRIELRIGIHSGEVTLVRGDVFGDAVNVASRVESITEPMEICFTRSVALAMNREEISTALRTCGLRAIDDGKHTLKGVGRPIKVFRVVKRTADGKKPRRRGARRARAASNGAVGAWVRRSVGAAVAAAAVLSLGLLASAVLLHSFWLGVVAAMLVVATFPWRLTSRRVGIARGACVALVLALAAILPETPVREIQDYSDGLARELQRAEPARLSTSGAAAIYLLTWATTLQGPTQADPTASRRGFYLHFPGPATRTWRSHQFMASTEVKAVLREFARGVDRERGSQRVTMRPAEIMLGIGRRERRATLQAAASRKSNGWLINATVGHRVDFGQSGRVRLLAVRDTSLTVAEILLWDLQERGWLFPYAAQYRWSFRADDRRLVASRR